MSENFRFLVQDFAYRHVEGRQAHPDPVTRAQGRRFHSGGTPVGHYFMPIVEQGAKSPRV